MVLHVYTSVWREGQLMHPRGFGFGGQLREDHTCPVHVIICDDEVCCFDSEHELFCWRFEGCTKGQTPAKTKGSFRHDAQLKFAQPPAPLWGAGPA